MTDLLRLSELEDDRFDRLKRISWWDQQLLSRAKVLLIGAGALGNEILKSLALLGVGNVVVADRDRVELSNLSRSVLFRDDDIGQEKAAVAVRRARDIYPDMHLQPLCVNIVYDLGLGVYRWADVILGGLDNREARVAINQAVARVGKAWIDGAIEGLNGVARRFDPASGACYECTMNDVDWQMLEARRSCALLSREEMEQGKTPTTPTTASVIAGIQCQEAIKALHGLPTLSGSGFVFDGTHHESYTVQYPRKDDCPAHEAYEPIEALPWKASQTPVGQLVERVRRDLGPSAVVETNADLLASLRCPQCEAEEPMFMSLGRVVEEQARCAACGAHRVPEIYHTIDGSEPFLDKTLAEIGIPPWDILGGRDGMKQCFYELAGDREAVLAPEMAEQRSCSQSNPGR